MMIIAIAIPYINQICSRVILSILGKDCDQLIQNRDNV